MPYKSVAVKNLRRDTLRKIADSHTMPAVKRRLAELGVLYSEDSNLLSYYLDKLVHTTWIFPQHLPTQASFRWSTVDPPLTNWPRRCIATSCPQGEHEWTDECWSIRDIIKPPEGWVMVTWDHDNIEGRIHDIVINDTKALEAHREGLDLHTITCCDLFGYSYPTNLRNPHTSPEDAAWRTQHAWQGKDTARRVLAKNFNHGSKYTDSYLFVRTIPHLESYGVNLAYAEGLAKRYIKSKGDSWNRKLLLMEKIRRERIARTLYGARRLFFTSERETGHKGFSHMISGTVSHYNNETLLLLDNMLRDDCILAHNAHDGDKVFIRSEAMPSKEELLKVIQRSVEYEGRSITLTGGMKIYE